MSKLPINTESLLMHGTMVDGLTLLNIMYGKQHVIHQCPKGNKLNSIDVSWNLNLFLVYYRIQI